ncbi:MAG: endopeptidase La [Oscillospiraceae bacterium]
MSEIKKYKYIKIPTIPLRGMVAFPESFITFDVGREYSINASKYGMKDNNKIFLVAQRKMSTDNPTVENIYTVGVLAKVKQIIKLTDKIYRVLVQTYEKARIFDYYEENGFIYSDVDIINDGKIPHNEIENEAMIRVLKDSFNNYVKVDNNIPIEDVVKIIESNDISFIFSKILSNVDFSFDVKQQLLEVIDINIAIEYLCILLEKEIKVIETEREIVENVKNQIGGNQREYFLRQQLKVIKDELGEYDEDVDEEIEKPDEYMIKLESLGLAEESFNKVEKEIKKLAQLSVHSQEYTVVSGYLDICLNLPFNKSGKDNKNLNNAKNILEKEHFGLKKVKEVILQYVAVNNLTENKNASILCLVGPPGVGKTSIAKSIARSLKKKFARISLGGVSDEAEIRGHRKTYIGAMPGKIIKSIQKSGVNNPVILLDEIDKLSSNLRGDPASALLEVLDGEQNKTFEDNYIEIPFDLSKVFFIATANNPASIPAPLRDRMDIIYIDSYTREEKFNIVKKHLVKKQIEKNGLDSTQIKFNDKSLYAIIDGYTKEAGVRTLERNVSKICRQVAKEIVFEGKTKVNVTENILKDYLGTVRFKSKEIVKDDKVGIVNGLAWTSVGGETMPIEVNIFEGNGKVKLTGSLGDVMQESAHIAINYIRSIAKDYDVDTNFYKNKDIHIHVPDGAVPKDGPSAGMALATVVLSALTGAKIKGDIAMTGEITIRGNILPIGGLPEKSMGAYKEHIKQILIPIDNISNLDDVDDIVKENIEFIPINTFSQTIKYTMPKLFNKNKKNKENKENKEYTLNC